MLPDMFVGAHCGPKPIENVEHDIGCRKRCLHYSTGVAQHHQATDKSDTGGERENSSCVVAEKEVEEEDAEDASENVSYVARSPDWSRDRHGCEDILTSALTGIEGFATVWPFSPLRLVSKMYPVRG